jgi:NAD(P)H-hydrate epimerase
MKDQNFTTVTVRQIRGLDRAAISRCGIPPAVLMENAGRAVAQEACRMLGRARPAKVAVVCGLGNNAGDGLVAARHLADAGVEAEVFMAGDPAGLSAQARVNYQILKKLRLSVRPAAALERALERADLAVDAVFGVGLNREVSGPFRGVIETVNRRARKVLAVDIPSGLDGTTGKIYGVCARADVTVTFSFAKQGFFRGRGPEFTGRIRVVDIGIPKKLTEKLRSPKSRG